MTDLIFLDTETTGLSLEDDIWEFAGIRRSPDGAETRLHLFIQHDWKKCSRLPESFRRDHEARFPSPDVALGKGRAAAQIIDFLARRDDEPKPHVVGAVPNFDTERLALLLKSQQSEWEPTWHHHLIDVENLAVGWLAGTSAGVTPPWDSDALSMSIGIDPKEFRRHEAMADAEWAMAIYDRVMGLDR